MAAENQDIRYLTPVSVDTKKKKYCRFKKSGIKYIDYKDTETILILHDLYSVDIARTLVDNIKEDLK